MTTRAMGLIVGAVMLVGCIASEDQVDDGVLDSVDITTASVERLTFGSLDTFDQGVTALEVPRRAFVIVDGDDVTAFDRTDPNNGCPLFEVTEDERVANGLDVEARFTEPCHGSSYDIAGTPLHCEESRSMRSIDVFEEGGEVMVGGIIIDPDEPAPASRPNCPDPAEP